MRRNRLIVAALALLFVLSGGRVASADFFGGVGPWITGNDTGGIIPYAPDLKRTYRRLAADYCARWGRLSHVTSVDREYGGYISFVCIDRPGVIH